MTREQELDKQIRELQEERELVRSRKMLACPKCGERTSISKYTIVRTHHYVSPSGCMGGDYWQRKKEYYLWCPTCQQFERTFAFDWHGGSPNDYPELYKFINEYERYFGEIIEDYGESDGSIVGLRKEQEKRDQRERDRYDIY